MILVIGGAGYIGSHTVKELIAKGYNVLVIDNLSTGHLKAVDNKAIFIKGNLGDPILLEGIFSRYPIQAVMHFAADSLVEESMINPLKYYKNNVANSLNLLKAMEKFKVQRFIFSSTCATYGAVTESKIDETLATVPINPYGRSKLMMEQILEDLHYKMNLSYISLRYFNAAGAHISGEIGEDHRPETHLIPIILEHLNGKRENIQVFGTSYPTHDGTCIRDYIHVTDIARAHLLALEVLLQNLGKERRIYNLGTEKGYSILEVIRECERVTGKKATILFSEKRKGDPPKLVATSKKIQSELNWAPEFSLSEIIETAWNWHRHHIDGFK